MIAILSDGRPTLGWDSPSREILPAAGKRKRQRIFWDGRRKGAADVQLACRVDQEQLAGSAFSKISSTKQETIVVPLRPNKQV
jgi:hypothetical protein